MTRIVGKLNTIWSKAGIYFGLDSIVREPVVQIERFRQLVERKKGEIEATDYLTLLPRSGRAFDGFQAFFFHELPMNGAPLVDDIVIVQEQARLKPVKGGIDEPLPRVLGFTFGVTLGLDPRREPETSLLAVGTTGIELDEHDIDLARNTAKAVKGVMTFAETQKTVVDAQAAGQTDLAKRLRQWMAEVAAPKRDTQGGRTSTSDSPKRPQVCDRCD